MPAQQQKLQADYASFHFALFQDAQMQQRLPLSYPDCIEAPLSQLRAAPRYLTVDGKHNFLNLILQRGEINYENILDIDDVFICWEIRPIESRLEILYHAKKLNKPVIFAGDSFLRSINTFVDKSAEARFQKGISFTFDDLTCYFDATRPSRLEQMLNNPNLIISEAQLARARSCIDRIVETHLTKYNHQAIYTPDIGRKGVKKVLLVDQTYGDMSILKGMGSEQTFNKMLQDAITENHDADIIIKTHPDTIAGCGGYYTGIKPHDNIYTQTSAINPISLIKYCDEVYVCSTQLGFEGLMCGKRVHVYGMPFYAGWGLSHDAQVCERRSRKRSLEEIFYIAYIMYTYYVNPISGEQCEIEEAMDYLLLLRDEYFAQNGVMYDL